MRPTRCHLSLLHRVSMSSAVVLLLLLMQLVAGTRRFAFFSDVDYDSYFQTTQAAPCSAAVPSGWGNVGCSTPRQLLYSFTTDIFSAAPQFSISCGDFIANSFMNVNESLTAFDAVANLTRQGTVLSRISPPTIVTAMGERDLESIDERSSSGYERSSFLQSVGDILYNRSFLDNKTREVFSRCGYYSTLVREARTIVIIVLNTNLWLAGSSTDAQADPCGQLAFLRAELETAVADDRSCIIVGHHPPGIAPVSSGDQLTPKSTRYWKGQFQEEYRNIVFKSRQSISFQLFGHTGMFFFVADANLGAPLFVVPSASFLLGRNPSYLSASIDESTGKLQSLQQRYFDVSRRSWRDGIFIEEMLGVGSAIGDVGALASASQQLAVDDVMWARFQTLRGGGMLALVPLCDELCRTITACATTSISLLTVGECVRTTLNTALKIIFTVLMVVGGAFIFATGFLLFLRREVIRFDRSAINAQ